MLKRHIKQVIGAAKAPMLKYGRLKKDGLVILMFHKVSEHDDGLGITISPALFEAALSEISRHCEFVRLDRHFADSSTASSRLKFAITFDDGYVDNYTVAWPILRRLGVPATIFLTTGAIDRTNTLWFERVDAICRVLLGKEMSMPELDIARRTIGGASDMLVLQRTLHQALKAFDSQSRDKLISELERKHQPAGDAMAEMMSWDQIREMAQDDIEFGAHTVTHPILSMEKPPFARDEIVGSKSRIEQKLDLSIKGFAYPNGTASDYTSENVSDVGDAGFEYACTTRSGINSGRKPSYELMRASIFNAGIDKPNGGLAPGRLWTSCLASG